MLPRCPFPSWEGQPRQLTGINRIALKEGRPGDRTGPSGRVSYARRRRSALVTTETELKLIATAAMTGESRMPKAG